MHCTHLDQVSHKRRCVGDDAVIDGPKNRRFVSNVGDDAEVLVKVAQALNVIT